VACARKARLSLVCRVETGGILPVEGETQLLQVGNWRRGRLPARHAQRQPHSVFPSAVRRLRRSARLDSRPGRQTHPPPGEEKGRTLIAGPAP
jgi:hypothetical protein